MPASSQIIDLRKLLAERFSAPALRTGGQLPSGLPALDQALGGVGLPKGGITEIASPRPSAGSASLLHAFLGQAVRDASFVALIDGADSFDPQPLGCRRLRHLLWVRCAHAREAIKAADLLVRDGNFPLVILDLVLNKPEELRKIPQSNWYRLQRLVEPSTTALLILTRRRMISSAQTRLVLAHSWKLADFRRADSLGKITFEGQRGQTHAGKIAEAI